MARLPGFELLGHPQHVISHGKNRQIIFVADEDEVFYQGNRQNLLKITTEAQRTQRFN